MAVNCVLVPTDPNVPASAANAAPSLMTQSNLKPASENGIKATRPSPGNPFTVPPISDQLTLSASTRTVDTILDGQCSAEATTLDPTIPTIRTIGSTFHLRYDH
mmetsp:Transcript_37436/g.55764  ORF Transcript_37436/g.55764 Transcript_37436/m.55764 type:complete len:104 (-) Transcript_37436:660-971(-)|eukprot:CAMPEP_0194044696 /NCGR_PEP_ID=MMETSP0009_2-20130614/16125_1 /TAXON_ID=210454 /ORGANISM="Grammatophora oceanica, Strain CCMP 410" /LENGTH=103 /DNA_ID=CAMNT_0038689289 /DNA_START=455 /DNA_END=766 /DNA_ORIENTATION=-